MTTGPVRFGAAHHLGKWVPWIPMGTHRDTHRTPTETPTGMALSWMPTTDDPYCGFCVWLVRLGWV
jgi:hypothetical protein